MSRRSLLLSTLTAAILVAAGVAPAHAAARDGFTATPLQPSEAPIDGAKTASGQLAESDLDLFQRSDAAVVPVLLKIDVDAVASYTGGIEGLAATSPELTGTNLVMSDPAITSYRAYVESVLADAAARVTEAVPSAEVTGTYAVAYGGLAVTVEASDAAALLDVDGVAAVQDDTRREQPAPQTATPTPTPTPTTTPTPAQTDPPDGADDYSGGTLLGAEDVWPLLGGRDLAGEGVTVGVIGDDEEPVSLIAPGSTVIAYPVAGGSASDAVAAVEQAIEDGVDVLSIADGSPSMFADPVGLASLDAYATGIAVTSSPDAAGVAALLKAAHPTWTPGHIMSALITTSLPSVDDSTRGLFGPGTGGIRADRAVAPTLTISETAANLLARATDVVERSNLNIPSITIDPLPGAAKVTRTVTNVSDRSQVLAARGSDSDGVPLSVSPATFSLEPGDSQELSIVVDGTQAADGWHRGQVTITSTRQSANEVVIPVAANVADARITLSQTCTPAEITRSTTTTCTVTASSFLPVEVDAGITVSSNPLLRHGSATAPATRTAVGTEWSGVLGVAEAPTITSIEQTPGAADEYAPLSTVGIAPIADFEDESFVDIETPSFRYGGEVYDRVSIDANGYVVVGGGIDSGRALLPTDGSDSEAPKNALAPLWTDLDPGAGGGVRVGVVADGTTQWLVVDWEAVPTFSGNAINTFQVWIRLGTTESQWFSYGSPPVGDAESAALIAAENRDGTSGVTVPLPASPTEYTVITEDSAGGGTVSFDYTLEGLQRGSWSTLATLSSPVLGTVPAQQSTITVE